MSVESSLLGPSVTEEQRELIAQLLERQGYLELTAAYVCSTGVKLAPTIDDKALLAEQAMMKLEHVEWLSTLYELLSAGDLLPTTESRVHDRPAPTSWSELAVARFLLEVAARIEFYECCHSMFEPHALVARKILADNDWHAGTGEAILVDLRSNTVETISAMQTHLARWLPVVASALGRPGAALDRRSVASGFKARQSEIVLVAYARELAETMRGCGLVFPTRELLGVPLPDDL